MKNNYLILIALLFCFKAFSQAPLVQVSIPVPSPACNPGDCTNLTAVYPTLEQTPQYAVTSVTYNPTFPFTGGTVLNASADDVWSPVVNLPFNFTFYGTTYTNVIVGSNGLISFDTTDAGGYCPWAFTATPPTTAIPTNSIYGVYQDTNIAAPPVTNPAVQNVNYYVLDTGVNAPPNRVFVANWNQLPQFLCGSGVGLQTSQIVIHEGTNIIEIFVSDRTPCPTWNSCSGLIGIQNAAGTVYSVPGTRSTGCWTAHNEAWQFTPTGPANVPSVLNWFQGATPVGTPNQNPLNVCPTGPTTYTAVVTYTNPNGTTFTVQKDITIDLATPLPNGNPHDITICNPATSPYTVDINENPDLLLGATNPSDYIINYYEVLLDAQNGAPNSINQFSDADLSTFSFSTFPKTIYIRIESVSTGCLVIRSFVINSVAAPSGTFSYAASPYCDSFSTPISVTQNALTSGGTYSAAPAGLILNSGTGTISPGSAAGNYTVTYAIAASPSCPAYTTSANVVIQSCICTVVASATAVTMCEDVLMTPITYTVTGGASAASVTAGALPAGVVGAFSGGGYTVSGTPTTPGVYNYTVTLTTATGNCSASTTINVNTQPNAGTAGTPATVCDSSTAAINLFNLINGEQAGGTWTRNPGGTGGTFNAAAGTFTPASGATSSTFTYTISATAPCTNSSSMATVNINPQPNAGLAAAPANVCDNSTAPIDLFSLITGEQPGGTWTRNPGGTGGTFNASAGTFTPAPGATSSTFDYTLTGTTPCVNSISTATVNISPLPNAGTAGTAATVCDNSLATINLFDLINGEQSGGTWTRNPGGSGGTFNAAAGTFTPAPGATNSTFTYTITATLPCPNATSIATVNINPPPNAGTAGTAADICDSSSATINLFDLINGEQPGGTWTRNPGGTGGVFDGAAGTFTPAPGATNSTFTYTIIGTAPCVTSTSTATINISSQPNAGTAGSPATICDDNTATINLFDLINGEQLGGTWTRNPGGSGGTFNAAAGTFTPTSGATNSTFTYTLIGAAPCINSTSVATVNISPLPDAGVPGTPATVCDSSTAAINLFDLINGEQPGGIWTRNPAGVGGTFNASAGTFTPAPGATSSTFTYTIAGIAPCPSATSVATVNINPQPVAGMAGTAAAICDNSLATINLFDLINGEQPGGTWTRNPGGTGGTFNASAGTFTPAPGATTSTFTYTLTGTAPCVTSTSIATINISPLPNAGTNGLPTTICDSNTATINLFDLINGEQPGGIWTRNPGGNGGIFNAAAGTFTPAAGATSSTFTYTIAGTAPCPDATSIATVNINPQPDAGIANAPATYCDSDSAPIDLFGLIAGEQPGGIWTRNPGGTGGTFNAAAGTFSPAPGATSSTFTYTLTGTSPCVTDSSTVTININPQPNAGTSDGVVICDSNNATINLFDLINGEQLGGTWTRNPGGTGGTFNAGAATFSPIGATSSSFTYTLTGTAPCVNSTSVATVTINHQPNAGTSTIPTTVCDDNITSIDLFSLISGEEPGGTWTRNPGGNGGIFNAAAGTFTPAPGATNSTFTYTLLGTFPCVINTSTASVNINPKPNAGSNNSATVCDNDGTAIDLFNLVGGTPQPGGTWTRNPGGSGGIFNASAGTFSPAPGATNSSFTYTVAGTAPCVNATSLITININPKRNAGTDNLTPTAICDSSALPIDLFSLITGEEAGGTWTRSNGSGGTFNAAAGTFIPLGATSSKFVYRLTGAAPCADDISEVNISVFPQPVAGNDGNTTVCESNNAVINLFDIITGEQSGGTWSRTGGTGGTFDANAGTFTPGFGATSTTFRYSIVAAAPCVDDFSIATININPSVTIALTSGSGNQNVCINSAVQTSIYTVGNGATGAVITSGGLPTGVTGSFDAATGKFTISGTPTAAGTFNYVIEATGTCPGAPISGQIVVNPRVTMVLNSAASTAFQFPCKNSSIAPITYLIGSGATGAVASGLPPGLTGSFNASTNIFTISGTVNTVGVYNFDVHTTGGCGPDVSLTGTIEVIQNVTIALNSPAGTDNQSLCINSQIVNIVYQVNNGGTGATIVAGSVPTGLQGSFSGGFFTISGTPTQSGEFSYTVNTSGGCSTASITGRIVVNALPTLAIDGGYICVDENGNPKPGSTFLLDTRLTGNYTFVWSDETGVIAGANGSTYEALAPGVYSVAVTNNFTHCSNTASVTVVPSYPPVKVVATATAYFADHQQIAVSVMPLGDYQYQLDNGAFQDSNQFIGVASGYHTITVRDRFLCGTKSTTILILNFPKFFTPNGDGFNDTWNIEDLKFIDEAATIYIFDRYGKLVKEISPKGDGWDGTMNARILPATDYWFKILYIDQGINKEFKSHFSLKR